MRGCYLLQDNPFTSKMIEGVQGNDQRIECKQALLSVSRDQMGEIWF